VGARDVTSFLIKFLNNGAILFRGFPMTAPQDSDTFVAAFE
jgi:hypothetical protein